MHKTLEFSDLLRLIDDRSTAFRAAVAAAPSLDLPVPTCPGWTLYDLVQHIGEGRRRWAATVAAGPDATARTPAQGDVVAPREREAALAWLAGSTELLLAALREAGPDQGCFTAWGNTQTPHTAGGVARHQVQEIAVHTYDAQLTVGESAVLPLEVGLDGVEENLFIASYSTSAWPHKPTAFDLHATEGRSWRLTVDGDGARTTRLPAPGEDPDAAGFSVHGTASELVLWLYNRISVDDLRTEGDRELLDLLLAWEPEDWA
ncbi:maleylpyruvate isomerase N-terminal domain-containing protein [Kitasatospora sp. NPDC002227]|uniref:maleylpyruvate isomerase N-terminal domain-containing protein n=1 Tax=Kitasatospora sp. NPDC002227 TaxID=3154773 RepID=UPI00332C0965